MNQDEAIEIVMGDIESLTTEEGYYVMGVIGDEKFPLKELASVSSKSVRIEWLKKIADKMKNKSGEAWKNGAVVKKITKTKDGPIIEQKPIPPPPDTKE